jgi:RNA polymerase sigma-70 factor (ECF subfamily)
VLHDVFLSFARDISCFELTGSLKGYLAKCIANCARDNLREAKREKQVLDAIKPGDWDSGSADEKFEADEESRRLANALNRLPAEQREVILLHLIGEMGFSEMSRLQGISVNTIKGRYRYGLEKLRSILNGEMRK